MNLRDIGIFNNLKEDELKEIQKNIDIEEKIFEKGSYIFNQGDIKKDLYFLIEGSVIVAKFDTNGKRSIIQTFNKKAVFGEVYAYLRKPYDFSALCKKDSRLLVIKDFRKLINIYSPKSFLINYIDLISKKCLKLSQKNQINTQFTLRQKIANFLLFEEDENLVKLDKTRQELADFLSTTRPSLSRELSIMEDEGFIRILKNGIKIKNRDDLINLIY